MQICHLQCLTVESRRGCKETCSAHPTWEHHSCLCCALHIGPPAEPLLPQDTHTCQTKPRAEPSMYQQVTLLLTWILCSNHLRTRKWTQLFPEAAACALLPVPRADLGCPPLNLTTHPQFPQEGVHSYPPHPTPPPPLTRWLSRGSWSRGAMLSRSLNTGQSGEGENRERQKFHGWKSSRDPSNPSTAATKPFFSLIYTYLFFGPHHMACKILDP